MIYIGVFAVVIFFAYCARISSGKSKLVMFCLSGGILVILGACRAETVGIDIQTYVKKYFILAQSVENIWQYVKYLGAEPLYLLLTYITAKVFNNIQFLYFFSELIIVVCVYLTIWKLREKLYFEIAVAFFALILYSQNFNIVRQSIAMAIILYAFSHLLSGHRKTYYFFFVLAVGFHYSAIVCIAIDLLYALSESEFGKKLKFLFVLSMFLMVQFYDKIFVFVVSKIPILPKRYLADKYLYREFNIPISDMCIWGGIFLLAVVYVYRKKQNAEFWFYIAGICLMGTIIGAQATFANRICWYFQYVSIIFVAQKDLLPIKRNFQNCLLGYGVLTSVMALYFGVMYVYLNAAGTYPYTFFWNS